MATTVEEIAVILVPPNLSGPCYYMATLTLPVVLIRGVRNVLPFDEPDRPGCVLMAI